MTYISFEKLRMMDHEILNKYLSIEDLTDTSNGPHAINLVIDRLKAAFNLHGYPEVQIKTSNRISNVSDEFDNLRIPSNSRQRSPEYVRYVNETSLLRSHTTPIIFHVLKEIKQKNLSDVLAFCPGICYRRDVIDKQRTGEPHKMDIWKIKKRDSSYKNNELLDLIKVILSALSPDAHYRTMGVTHSYTINGLAVEVEAAPDQWLKIFECGEISLQLLQDVGLDPHEYSVVGTGLGLERCAMLIKQIDDIRVLRAKNPAISSQMQHLEIYKPIMMHQSFQHEFSVIVPQDFTKEDICEIIRQIVGSDTTDIERVKFMEDLSPESVILTRDQKKVVFNIIFNSLDRVLTQQVVDSCVSKISKQFRALECEMAYGI
jgi:phenylalanyl-tRNA synthetase alpha chain